ncbi:serine hydrolase [Sphingopyxis sp. JAI128]|uniref:serine hydrolase domain-containing protein n=1 Tax=Sphingopyxis sp. JAI128 TaxID=2723066 RepID=UPI001614B40D|nr:serine hydrolase domain-containing protein [Sphingopyxis sp. JAI128]MBB6427898.1 CubicO group peptidase (beta-lactamase class C family) [Sphingopyxis sp. JAI128]
MSEPLSRATAPAPVRDYLLELMDRRSIPGLQVAVVNNGAIEMLDVFGHANVEHEVPATHKSIFSINSMAKAFTGVALMQLVEAGLLDLSAPINSYLDDLPEAWSNVTVLHLATLSSGVPEIMVYTADNSTALIGDGTVEGAWKAVYSAPMEYPVGEGYSYTQTNFALLGRIIERLAGKPFEEFIAERQFAVAGMPNTLYFNDYDVIANRANTYMNTDVNGKPSGRMSNSHLNWHPILRTAAGLHSTAEDLANWAIALQNGSLLSNPVNIETMRTGVTLFDGRPGIWGIGWLVGRSAAGRLSAPAGGSKAQMAFYPSGVTVVLLTNLIGAFPEQLAPVTGDEIDLGFMDEIAAHYQAV